jgi:hypothetical protein
MRRLHLFGLALVLTGTLNGCAGLGEGDFACPGHPSKPLCLSTAEVYRLTDGYAPAQPVPKAPTGKGAQGREDAVFLETFQ